MSNLTPEEKIRFLERTNSRQEDKINELQLRLKAKEELIDKLRTLLTGLNNQTGIMLAVLGE